MKLELEPFEKGTGWFLRLDGHSIATVMPSDIQPIADLVMGQKEYRNEIIKPITDKHYGFSEKTVVP